MLSGRRSLVRARVTKPGKVIELDHQQMLGLAQTDAELSGILMTAFILRRVELIAAGVGDIVLVGSTYSAYASDQRISYAQWTPIFLHRPRTRP